LIVKGAIGVFGQTPRGERLSTIPSTTGSNVPAVTTARDWFARVLRYTRRVWQAALRSRTLSAWLETQAGGKRDRVPTLR
jgi:hypothetical protein